MIRSYTAHEKGWRTTVERHFLGKTRAEVKANAEMRKTEVPKLRASGLSFSAIGVRLNISGTRAQQIYTKHIRITGVKSV